MTRDFDRCSSEGMINRNRGKIGGLAGRNWNTIRNCHFYGNVSGDETLGGLIGNNEGTISNFII